jgi:hypothetical protein
VSPSRPPLDAPLAFLVQALAQLLTINAVICGRLRDRTLRRG